MGKFVAYGRWTRISKISVSERFDPALPPAEIINEIESALNERVEVIASGFSPNQTICVTDLDSYVGDNFYDVFTPLQVTRHELPSSSPAECLLLEQSSHCWALSQDIEILDPNLLVVEWSSMLMPSGPSAVFGRPLYDGDPLTLIWPPYRVFENILEVSTEIFGIYPENETPTNDAFGRSIAPEYPDCQLAIWDWRRAARVQTGWEALNGKWSPTAMNIPSSADFVWPRNGFSRHPKTVMFRERLKKLYASLLEVAIFGEDLDSSWGAGQLGSDVYDHLEKRMSELGPILGITKLEQAAICWNGIYSGEDEILEDDLIEKYDPDFRVEDMTDRLRPDLITPSKPETSTYIYFESAKRAEITATHIAEHVVKLADDAGLLASWDGNPKSAIWVSMVD